MAIKRSWSEFVKAARKVHGYKFSYPNKLEVVVATTQVDVLCRKKHHGMFSLKVASHLSGSTCPVCNGQKMTTGLFIANATRVHGTTYSYSNAVYTSKKITVTIKCKVRGHGSFLQLPENHISGAGCPKCGQLRRSASNSDNLHSFIKKARKVHGATYAYGMVDYEKAQHLCLYTVRCTAYLHRLLLHIYVERAAVSALLNVNHVTGQYQQMSL